MDVRIAPCSADDLARLLVSDLPAGVKGHHEERFGWQQAGTAHYLLAWAGDRNVGRATLYVESKYADVRRRHPGAAEINALEADPQGRGTGTALIRAAERLAARHGHEWMGLAVGPDNLGAQRLYRRLGYEPWPHGPVIDEWTEQREDQPAVEHRDPCLYLLKPLGAPQP